MNLESTFSKLNKEHFLKGMKKDQIIRRLAFYMAELNMIHPFREGNGKIEVNLQQYKRVSESKIL